MGQRCVLFPESITIMNEGLNERRHVCRKGDLAMSFHSRLTGNYYPIVDYPLKQNSSDCCLGDC